MYALHASLATVLLLFATLGNAQIIVTDAVVHHPIAARLQAPIPAGAQIQGAWSSDTARWLESGDSTQIHIWAPIGNHKITFRGMWLKTRSITIEGETVQVLEGFGFLDHSAAFAVTGESEPDPPPPPPPGKRWGVILRQSEKQTPAQAVLFNHLRGQLTGEQLRIADPDNLGSEWDKFKQAHRESQLPLPVLVVVTDAGSVAKTLALPATVDAIKKELGL